MTPFRSFLFQLANLRKHGGKLPISAAVRGNESQFQIGVHQSIARWMVSCCEWTVRVAVLELSARTDTGVLFVVVVSSPLNDPEPIVLPAPNVR